MYLASGQHKEISLGRAGEPATAAVLGARLLERAEMCTLATNVHALRRARFAAADSSSALTLATLYNAGVSRHGGVLFGSQALGALLNRLGARRPANYRTEGIDSESAGTISVAIPEDRSFLGILRDSVTPLFEPPDLGSREPSFSFKTRGQPLKVDLFVRAPWRMGRRRCLGWSTHGRAFVSKVSVDAERCVGSRSGWRTHGELLVRFPLVANRL
jgi:hypothetical protein